MRNVGVKDVARRAGVAVGTVSNVLNRPDVVAEETKQRVLEAMVELGYVRNDAARSLRSGSRTIAMLVTDVANPFFTDVARGARHVADAHASTLAMFSSDSDAQREATYLGIIEEQKVLGLLFDGVSTAIDEIADRGTPVIVLNRHLETDSLCSVTVDDFEGGRLVARHFLDLGHERLAFVGGPMTLKQIADRHAGYEHELADGREMPAAVILTRGLTALEGRRAGERIVELPPAQRPTAVFAANDLIAYGILQALMMAGISVPDEVSIVGYDDIDLAQSAIVPLTSVRQPRDRIGAEAVRLLYDEVDDPEGHTHAAVVFAPELVVRESSSPVVS